MNSPDALKAIDLSDLQQDAICELMNIGIGNAANALSQMIEKEIELSVPELNFFTLDELKDYLAETNPGEIVAVRQGFTGNFDGDSILVFPKKESANLVKELFGSTVPVEQLNELEEEALAELGNVILNASMATLADMLKSPLDTAIPEVIHGTDQLLQKQYEPEHVSMFLKVRFKITQSDIDGHVLIVLDLGEAKPFLDLVDGFLQGI